MTQRPARHVILLFGILWLAACASSRVYDLPAVQKEFQSTIQRNDSLVNRSNRDFVEKKVLVETLARNNRSDYQAFEAQIKSTFEQMNARLAEINKAKAQMSELNGQISALGYNRNKVAASDQTWDRANQIVTAFDGASQKLIAGLANYSRATNTLSDLISTNKLFLNFDINDFQKHIQVAIRECNDTIKTMNSDLVHMERILNLSDANDSMEAPQAVFSQMGETAKEFSFTAQRLPGLSAKVKDTTLGVASISSVDSNWAQVQSQVGEFEEIKARTALLKRNFEDLLAQLQSALKK